MKSLKARFMSMREKFPDQYPSYLCFVRAIKGQRFSREKISKWLGLLVDKDDYFQNERKGVVEYLCCCSNMPEERQF